MVMMAIDRKLFRDLWHMKGQAFAIVLIIASGVALFVAQLAVLESLRDTRDDYYAEQRFADVFANCKRAPLGVADRIREIEGVDVVQTRVTVGVTLDVPGLQEPASGLLISIPDGEPPRLNGLFMRTGRLPDPAREGEVVVIESFAEANDYRVGDSITAVINGRRKELRMVGIALSPEHIYALPPDSIMPDDKRFGLMWMNETELAAAYDMEGAFNDVTLTLLPGASEREVIDRLDDTLERYGGLGAYPRADQQSYWFLENEITQLETFAIMVPLIFMGVAAFLLNVVIGRLVQTQRDQIAALKAFGYSNRQVAFHYGQLVGMIVFVGGAIGTGAGWWIGSLLIEMYKDYFQFPELAFHMPGWVPAAGVGITAAAAGLGTFNAVRRAAGLPPAEAMRPEPPPTYRATLVERLGLQRWMAQPSRMILRQLERRFGKALMAVTGMSFAVAILVMSTGLMDMMYHLIDIQTNVMHREDVQVTFHEPRSRAALHEIEAMPGVLYAEPFRNVPARLRFGHRQRRVAIQGIPEDARLEQVLDMELKPFSVPRDGILVSRVLADTLGIRQGDEITVEVMEGARPTRRVRVSGLIDDFIGLGAYMELDALNRLMREGDVISGVKLTVDDTMSAGLFEDLRERPVVSSVVSAQTAIQNIRRMLEESLLVSMIVSVLFAGIIAFGVVYNNARISLSERARELASLRVLGMTRGEISYILLGELAILTLASLPVGFLLGYWLTQVTLMSLNTEVIRIPMVVNGSTYALAATSVIVAAAISGLIVRERLDKLDLVEVLKTRE